MKTRWDAGQFKLKGKKHKNLSCGCCTISNYKHECFEKEAKEEILLAMINYKAEIYSGNPKDFEKPWSPEDKARLVKAMQHIFEQNGKA